MSRAGRRDGPAAPTAASSASTRTSSIARSIARSAWVRRLFWFFMFDLLLCGALIVAFVFQSIQGLPASARSGALLAAGSSWDLTAPRPDLAAITFTVTERGGAVHQFTSSSYVAFFGFVLGVALTAEIAALSSGISEARRIRRKLRPLNELALTAEVIGARAGAVGADAALGSAGMSTEQKFESLEHAIAEASVEAPCVSTGDKDLRSIEVALNGLLRRMQETKAQQARFVSDASHELRTPLAVIEGYVGMLDRWGKDDPAVLDESIAALKAESEHMSELVEQLLFLARGDSGRNMLERAVFDVDELLGEVAEESRMIDEAHRYEVSGSKAGCDDTSRDALRLTVRADRALVKQSMRIMVHNAARYSPAGTAITLSAFADPSGARIGYAVADEGMGLAASDIRHIFERFYRADDARVGHREGTGLGLAIAKWIVDAHGGEIEVVSREGIGTRFTVWFPADGTQAM